MVYQSQKMSRVLYVRDDLQVRTKGGIHSIESSRAYIIS